MKQTEMDSYANMERPPRYMKGKATYIEVFIIIWFLKHFLERYV